jgi:TatD DNase family protein
MFDFLVDSHCHLNMLQNERQLNLEAVVADAVKNGVKLINNIGTHPEEFDEILEVANKFKEVYASLGVHPTEIGNEIIDIEVLRKYLQQNKVIGIGETGLDYHYEPFDKRKQAKNFEIHIELARQEKKPLIVHSRDADEAMIEILQSEMKNGEFKFILHSFSSGEKLHRTALDLGGFISLSGMLTFKNAENIRNIARNTPINNLLIETDAPFLAPEPFRGQTNTPAFVRNTAEFLMVLFNLHFDEFQNITTKNFINLFLHKTAKQFCN